jgi:drug/metabolite transporter (DMT)-like permease
VTRRGLILFAAMCVIWGIPYLFIKIAVRDLSPATLVWSRNLLAALLLLPLAAGRDELRPLVRRWLPLIVFTVVEIAVPWLLLASAEQKLSSSLTALLIAAVPLIGVLLGLAVGSRERLGGRALGGLFVGLVGVAALVGLDTGGATALAIAEVLGVAFCYALGPLILDRYLSDLPALGVIAASLGLCALGYTPIALFHLPAATPGAEVIVSVLVLAFVCTALAFVLFFRLIAEVGPVRATVITYVNPAVAAIAGVVFLGESFTAGMGVGLVLILAGSALATRGGRRDEVGSAASVPAAPAPVPEP